MKRASRSFYASRLSVVRLIHVLPVHILSIVRVVSYVSHLFFVKSLHNVGIQCGEKFAIFNHRCFTAAAVSRLLDAEKENLWGHEGGNNN